MLLNLIKHQRPDIDKIYLCVKDLFESKYQLPINGREAFIHYLQRIDDVYQKRLHPTKERKMC